VGELRDAKTPGIYLLEVWTDSGVRLLTLHGERCTIGKEPDNDLAFPDDHTVSRVHAVLERYPAGWSVRDLSRNGTFVNGERVWQERLLHHDDQIAVGTARLVYRLGQPDAGRTLTASPTQPPSLTPREHEVLAQLCLPAIRGRVFTYPASDRQVAKALRIGEEAVRQHVHRLYDKFAITSNSDDDAEPRRVRLANQAMRRGAITMAELRDLARQQGPP